MHKAAHHRHHLFTNLSLLRKHFRQGKRARSPANSVISRPEAQPHPSSPSIMQRLGGHWLTMFLISVHAATAFLIPSCPYTCLAGPTRVTRTAGRQGDHYHHSLLDRRRKPYSWSSLAATTSSSSSSARTTVEGQTPVLLRADISGLSREQAVAWVHAWCSRSLPTPPPSSPASSSSSPSPTSATTRPFGGQSSSTTAYAAGLQAQPGLPVGGTSLPISPSLTAQGARVVCQGLGPAFLDIEVLGGGGGGEEGR